tara:strand:+ start:17001 stop:18095 length:1095 start_codon:yes stop_codon:yes gene_type:complete
MSKTSIEWTHPEGFKGESWNPVVGCNIVSKGCTHCYAMKQASRIDAMTHGAGHYAGTTRKVKGVPVWTGKMARAPEKTLTAPLRAKAPRCYFVNSMGDLFAEGVPDEWIDQVFAVMALAPQHRFLILTKRPELMRDYVSLLIDEHKRWCRLGDASETVSIPLAYETAGETAWPLANVWLGTSVEDQASADARIPALLETPAAKRFISAEPLLGPVDLGRSKALPIYREAERVTETCGLTRRVIRERAGRGWCRHDGNMHPWIDWVITGGESGKSARPMHPDWARSLRDQCAAAGVPYFLKQWGEWSPGYAEHGNDLDYGLICEAKQHEWPEGHCSFRVGKRAAGHLLDGVAHHNWPVDPAGGDA